jgi:hypothetical protein
MEKYGYKNISSRNEFEKATNNNGRFNDPGPVKGKELTNYDFVDLKSKGHWGMPGQTRHYVKPIEDLLKANDKMNKPVMADRKPKGYVAW